MGVNWVLIIITVIVALLTVGVSVYLLVIYQHPEDRNQAWVPKIIVLTGMCVAIWTVLLFPLDVANQQSCALNIPLSSCTMTFPMQTMWEVLYISSMVLVFAIIPFMVLYYEADSDWGPGKRIGNATIWTVVIAFIFILIVGLAWGFAGYATYTIKTATSGILPVTYLANGTNNLNTCILPFASFTPGSAVPTVNTAPPFPLNGFLCDAGVAGGTDYWTVRVSLVSYAMTIVATMGWVLFMIFGAIGLVAIPVDLVREFIGRPRKTITRAQYVERAKDLANRARDIKTVAQELQKQERMRGRSRKWRRNYAAIQQQVTVLEQDEDQLQKVFPQGEDPTYAWTITVIMYWVKLLLGIASFAITIMWVLQIILYVLISPPVSPLLNTVFTDANNAFPLFGTLLFGIFVFYLQFAVIKGNFKFGLNLGIFRVYPVKTGATMMGSFMINVALVLLATTACIQFAAAAFALYANGTTILNVFGNTLSNLEGLSYLYTKNIFIYIFLAIMLLTCLVFFIRGTKDAQKKKSKSRDTYTM